MHERNSIGIGPAEGVPPGWYRLRMALEVPHGYYPVRIALVPSGPGEIMCLALPATLDGKVDHIFKIPFTATLFLKSATLRPCPAPNAINLRRLSSWSAALRMGLAALSRHPGTDNGAWLDAAQLPDVGPGQPHGVLEGLYRNARRPLAYRSLSPREYERWRNCLPPVPTVSGETHSSRVTVVLGPKCPSLEATLESLNQQTLAPAAVLYAEKSETLPSEIKTSHVLFLKAGDRLEQEAIRDFELALDECPDADIVACDEDRIGPDGSLTRPVFKPVYDPILEEASGYLGRGCVYSTACLTTSTPKALNITAHIPRVLLHVLDESLRPPSRSVRNANLPPASLIIPTRDNAAVLKPCVKSLLANTDYPDFELIIVDNGSVEPEALDYLADLERRHEAVVVRADIPFNYSKLNNLGTACARGEVLAFLNNDIEALHPDWLAILTEWAVREDIGCAGARLLYPNRRIQHAGIILGINGCAGHAWKGSAPESSTVDFRLRYPRTVSANTGACLVVARDRLNRLGGFDETLAVAFNDVDFCLRLQQAGLRNVWTPEATLIHHESASGRRNDTPRKKASLAREKGILRQRWGNTLDTDPYYSPNLTLACEDGGLAVPPRLPNGTDAF